MKKISIFQKIARGCLALTCALSFVQPSQASAACCPTPCCDDNNEYEGGGWFGGGAGRTGLILGGAALVGAAAGAIAGNASGGKGHRGRTGARGPTGFTGGAGSGGLVGPTGPVGPTAFVADPDTTNSLIFTSNLNISIALLGGLSITPFIIYPDGRSIEGPTLTGVLPIGLNAVSTPAATNLVYGTYTVGYRIISTGILGLTVTALANSVIASRNGGSVTEVGTLGLGLALSLLTAGQSQVAFDYAYDDLTIPTP